ncbi:MAG: hypothetical protein QOK37_524 [Thermoanaerobaculia bacterium]|jgi:hypothetical protein|nr:hypothetical protein [Thermoanaerobaculia bacterium]
MRLVILLLTLSFDVRHATDSPQVFAILQQLAIDGAQRFDQREIATFLVRDSNGMISSLPWPQTGRFRSEYYHGTIPAGTVALAHTHPWQADQHPSQGDIEQARRLHLPMFVVTRWNLYGIDSSGNVITLFARSDWTRSTKSTDILTASK